MCIRFGFGAFTFEIYLLANLRLEARREYYIIRL